MKDIESVVSENIQKILTEFNLNQNELAKIAGVSESTVGKWVLKKSTPRMGAIEKISDHFNLPKSYILEEDKSDKMINESNARYYNYFPTSISAGLPMVAEPVAEYNTEKINLPDSVMGKWAGNKDIYITRVNGESMNLVIPDQSLIAVKPVELTDLKDGDIVVYRYDNEHAVKRIYKHDDKVIFRPDSSDLSFTDLVIGRDSELDLKIKGKVVLYIVEMD